MYVAYMYEKRKIQTMANCTQPETLAAKCTLREYTV